MSDYSDLRKQVEWIKQDLDKMQSKVLEDSKRYERGEVTQIGVTLSITLYMAAATRSTNSICDMILKLIAILEKNEAYK